MVTTTAMRSLFIRVYFCCWIGELLERRVTGARDDDDRGFERLTERLLLLADELLDWTPEERLVTIC